MINAFTEELEPEEIAAMMEHPKFDDVQGAIEHFLSSFAEHATSVGCQQAMNDGINW